MLEPFLRKEPPEPVRHVLRLGAAGLLLLDTPSHAAVATAVALARAAWPRAVRRPGQRGAAPRGRGRRRPRMQELDAPRLDTPAWLWASWGDQARAIALAHQHEAPLDMTLRPGAAAPEGGEPLPTGSVRFPAGTRVTELPGFDRGEFWVQDAAAALPARLLARTPGERVADLCAAPGGKTAQLAAAGATVIAVERDPARMAAPPAEPAALASAGGDRAGRRDRVAAAAAVRRRAARCAVQRHRHDPPPSRRAASEAAA